MLGRAMQLEAHLIQELEILGLIPSPATYFCFSFSRFKKGSCQLLVKEYALNTGKLL